MFYNKMVQSIIDVGTREDKIINIVKAQQGLKNKSDAVSLVLNVYADAFLETQLRPEFIERMNKIDNEKGVKFRDIGELKDIISN
ncbi:DUF2683 family protein [archaeon]|jgi:hypothetical protein|nr:DUF2683 family protein [archaeon]MBT4373724.1 DUF2683 family protein [archaeon]MBT4531778.1 DUF2683 family protein [archaeon]MBT7001890.1 DUF2683 family protein [archaeon]MBT7281875.1 DUF2683 family protein [archaeon]